MSSLTLLDVGHGNCAILHSGSKSAVIDAPIGALLLDTLRDMGITHVDAAFVSHADKDHLAGIVTLLTSCDVHVGTVYVNPDAHRKSKLWKTFRAAVSVAERGGTCFVYTSLSSTAPGEVAVGSTIVKVVAPSAALALTGVGGQTLSGKIVTANSLSAALNIIEPSEPGVLLAGDLDEVGLEDALHHGANLRADLLVFPHHGGSSGATPQSFTRKLLNAVQPRSVYFSNGRSRFENPQPLIVEEVIQTGCAVACAQLSRACSDTTLTADHLEPIRAKGRADGQACAGSVSVNLVGGAHRSSRDAEEAFARFVSLHVPTPLCRARKFPALPI